MFAGVSESIGCRSPFSSARSAKPAVVVEVVFDVVVPVTVCAGPEGNLLWVSFFLILSNWARLVRVNFARFGGGLPASLSLSSRRLTDCALEESASVNRAPHINRKLCYNAYLHQDDLLEQGFPGRHCSQSCAHAQLSRTASAQAHVLAV